MSLTEEEVRAIANSAADAAAERTVEKMLVRLGMDTSDPMAMQQDSAWVRQARLGEVQVRRYVKRTIVTTLIAGALFLIWQGLKSIGAIQ